MAEIIAAAATIASVAQLGDYAAQLSIKLFSYAASVQTADKAVASFAKEISLASVVLKELWAVLEEEHKVCWSLETSQNAPRPKGIPKDIPKGNSKFSSGSFNGKSYVSASALKAVEATVKECLDVFDDVKELMERSLGVSMADVYPSGQSGYYDEKLPGQPSKLSTLHKFKFPFKQPRLDVLRGQLDRLKISLTLMLNVLSFARDYTMQKQDAQNLAIQKDMIERLSRSEFLLRQKYAELQKTIEYGELDGSKSGHHTQSSNLVTKPSTDKSVVKDDIAQDQPPEYEDAMLVKTNNIIPPFAKVKSTLQKPPEYVDLSKVKQGELLLCFNLVRSVMILSESLEHDPPLSKNHQAAHDRAFNKIWDAEVIEWSRLRSVNRSFTSALRLSEKDHVDKMRSLVQQLVHEVLNGHTVPGLSKIKFSSEGYGSATGSSHELYSQAHGRSHGTHFDTDTEEEETYETKATAAGMISKTSSLQSFRAETLNSSIRTPTDVMRRRREREEMERSSQASLLAGEKQQSESIRFQVRPSPSGEPKSTSIPELGIGSYESKSDIPGHSHDRDRRELELEHYRFELERDRLKYEVEPLRREDHERSREFERELEITRAEIRRLESFLHDNGDSTDRLRDEERLESTLDMERGKSPLGFDDVHSINGRMDYREHHRIANLNEGIYRTKYTGSEVSPGSKEQWLGEKQTNTRDLLQDWTTLRGDQIDEIMKLRKRH